VGSRAVGSREPTAGARQPGRPPAAHRHRRLGQAARRRADTQLRGAGGWARRAAGLPGAAGCLPLCAPSLARARSRGDLWLLESSGGERAGGTSRVRRGFAWVRRPSASPRPWRGFGCVALGLRTPRLQSWGFFPPALVLRRNSQAPGIGGESCPCTF